MTRLPYKVYSVEKSLSNIDCDQSAVVPSREHRISAIDLIEAIGEEWFYRHVYLRLSDTSGLTEQARTKDQKWRIRNRAFAEGITFSSILKVFSKAEIRVVADYLDIEIGFDKLRSRAAYQKHLEKMLLSLSCTKTPIILDANISNFRPTFRQANRKQNKSSKALICPICKSEVRQLYSHVTRVHQDRRLSTTERQQLKVMLSKQGRSVPRKHGGYGRMFSFVGMPKHTRIVSGGHPGLGKRR